MYNNLIVMVFILIQINLNEHSWVAINEQGVVIRKGIASGGMNRCPENGLSCRTPVGKFKVISIDPRKYRRSSLYPVDCDNKKKCGARMYYFVLFHKEGFGIHGSDIPLRKKNQSHGCVRVSKEDAKWINQHVVIGDKIEILKY